MYKQVKYIVCKGLETSIHLNKLSKIYQPYLSIPKGAELKQIPNGHKLLIELGIIRQSSPGCFHLLPLGLRSINKLNSLVDNEMSKLGAQKIETSLLIHEQLWKNSGRLQNCGRELFTLTDRHDQNYLLGPTFEESVTEILSKDCLSYKQYPIRFYQIGPKFRDEIKPRLGLIRSRQFLMKDMYTFDIDAQSAKITYEEVCDSYDSLFRILGIDTYKVTGSNGIMGGNMSHEYHFKTDIGEDLLCECNKCGASCNLELAVDKKCPTCKSSNIQVSKGIEVAHTFFLGSKYTKAFNANFVSKDSKKINLQMGCFGLGITRILSAGVEILSSEHEIRWPHNLEPYKVIIIPPKTGSKEANNAQNLLENIYRTLDNLEGLKNEILVDDRTHFTIGKRIIEAKRVGYPFIIVLGQKITEECPLYEINNLNTNEQLLLNFNDLINYINNKLSNKT